MVYLLGENLTCDTKLESEVCKSKIFTDGKKSYEVKVTEGSSFYEMICVITVSQYFKIPCTYISRRNILYIYVYIYCLPINP